MSLSQEPAFARLKGRYVCGFRDITDEPYSGRSGIHAAGGNAIQTTNGAGPHNLQLFVLAPDGTVLHVLPGYWRPGPLVHELDLAEELAVLWEDGSLSREEKSRRFRALQLGHGRGHPPEMVRRSRMQAFDMKYEATRRPTTSDTILDLDRIEAAKRTGAKLPRDAFKTVDRLLHERMATRPFVPFDRFDTAAFVDYGRPRYEKHEDERDAAGIRDEAMKVSTSRHRNRNPGRPGPRPR